MRTDRKQTSYSKESIQKDSTEFTHSLDVRTYSEAGVDTQVLGLHDRQEEDTVHSNEKRRQQIRLVERTERALF